MKNTVKSLFLDTISRLYLKKIKTIICGLHLLDTDPVSFVDATGKLEINYGYRHLKKSWSVVLTKNSPQILLQYACKLNLMCNKLGISSIIRY